MFEISLRNNKKFDCDHETTIFQAAKSSGIFLEHSCLTARCRSCVVKVEEGQTVNETEEFVLSAKERNENYVLSCNAKPLSNLVLDVEDLPNVELYEKKIFAAKINSIDYLTEDVIKVVLRLPPNANFKFISGQYVNLIKGNINRSYSIANSSTSTSELQFFIKKYDNGIMSQYWFNGAKLNDLLRLEGPLGSFFLRDTNKDNIIFLATGTGVAPIKSILEDLEQKNFKGLEQKHIWVFVGARYEQDLLWKPQRHNQISYAPVLSRAGDEWTGDRGYVQETVLKEKINLNNAQVYACGSNEMINSARQLLVDHGLNKQQFYSDAFVQTN